MADYSRPQPCGFCQGEHIGYARCLGPYSDPSEESIYQGWLAAESSRTTVRSRSRRQAEQDGWQRYFMAEHDLIRLARQRNTLASLAIIGWLGFLRMLALYYLGW